MVAPHNLQCCAAIEVRQFVIRQDDIGPEIFERMDERFPRSYALRSEYEVSLAQLMLDQLGIGGRIFQHQHPQNLFHDSLLHNFTNDLSTKNTKGTK